MAGVMNQNEYLHAEILTYTIMEGIIEFQIKVAFSQQES